MTIAAWCILAVALLPLITIGSAKMAGRREFDNADPRNPRFYGEGFRARAWAAHLNAFEAFPFFAVAVLFAEMRDVAQTTVDTLALCFVSARIAYAAAYLAGRPTLRSAAWAIGLGLNILIFVLPAFAHL